MRNLLLLFGCLAVVLAGCGGSAASVDPLAVAAEQAALVASDTEPEAPDTTTTTIQETTTTTTMVDDEASDSEADPASNEPDLGAEAVELDLTNNCSSAPLGLRSDVPEGWSCRPLSNPAPGGDGYTLFNEDNTLNVTIGIGPHTYACDLFDSCGDEAVEISDNFSDTSIFQSGGITEISGTYAGSETYLLVISNDPISESEDADIRSILDSTRPTEG